MKILIMDGYNLIYRAKHSGFGRKRNKDDESDRSIVFSFTRSVRALINQHAPDKVYFVLEGRPAARLQLADDYKANRVYEPDPGFGVQRRLIKDLVRRWPGMEVVRHPEFECDDVANAIAQRHAADGDSVIIVSSDTDFYQSVGGAVRLYNPVKKQFVEPPVQPDEYVAWKALRGDAGDNIEGFRGIGNVRAAKLVEDPAQLAAFLKEDVERQQKFDHNTKMIAFEPVDISTCETVFTFNDDKSMSDFRARLYELGFFSITSDKAWRKFSEPIANVRC